MIEFILIMGGTIHAGLLAVLIYLMANKNKTTYLGMAKEFDPNKDVTTIMPMPLSAATCTHSWTAIVDRVLEMPHEKKQILVLECRNCGMVDKTVQTTSALPPPLPPPPCKHDWTTQHLENLDMPHEKKLIHIMVCKNCGAVDKTTEVTAPVPAPAWTKEQCRHKWDVEKRVLIDSAYEQMLESIKVRKDNYSSAKKIDPNKALDLDLNNAPNWMFRKTYVSIRTCTVCGEIDKTIASNFDVQGLDEQENNE
jgi:predicted Zn-ribbon and HTH transcriptional regulator